MAIRIGAAGSDGLGYVKAITKAARMGLGCMEVAFTYGVRVRPHHPDLPNPFAMHLVKWA